MKRIAKLNDVLVDPEKITNPKIKAILQREGEGFWFFHKENYTEHKDSDPPKYSDHKDHTEYHEKYSDGSCQQ
jgi:hypothetical protein